MLYDIPLQAAPLIKRYKRFLADIVISENEITTIHCPNTGSMKNCLDDVKQVWFWDSGNPKRKYPHTLELIETNKNELIGVNTGRANALVKEALETNRFAELSHDSFRSEVKYGQENSRIDFLLQHNDDTIWVEVKSVTLMEHEIGSGRGFFPDSISSRGTKHLRELTEQVQNGDRAILLFCVQHTGIQSVSVAEHIDPTYAEAFAVAVQAGVEVIALGADISTKEISLQHRLKIIL